MIHRAYHLLSTSTAFSDECNKLRFIFLKLDYSINLSNAFINKLLHGADGGDASKNTNYNPPPPPPQSANSVKRRMQNLTASIGVSIILSRSSRGRKLVKFLPVKRTGLAVLTDNAWFTNI